ncbi:FAD-dependent oxidoreductase [Aspergillus fijiensis CBS 313.89]|uniref:FAD binding monooxygenase n=1 Tax=Aspergillus fijiensis CBS 313.89 TaxID=1448319 RepID=A0A8G1VWP5_9EURO|nr:FAD binding monooxygenase [Aspergillus fijiensis CBS 313.89]RAK74478.1 FAD binding monooxygenase [Aspergillus fijiensis CBS 313.89]
MEQASATTKVDVLIVGGGIGGLTLAGICKKLGITYKVLERSAEITPVGAGISLAPNCLRILEQLGHLDFIRRKGQPLRKIQIFRNSTQWSLVDYDWVQEKFGYSVYSIERHSMHQALYQGAGPEHVLLDAEVVDIEDVPTAPSVQVRLADGRQLAGQIVVGADGIRSATRRILAATQGLEGANTIRFTGRTHMTGYTHPLQHLGPADLGVATWVFYDDSILTSWPCIDNRQWFVGVKSSELKNPTRSSWKNATQAIINDVYGDRFHPFGEYHRVRDVVNLAERVTASDVFEETTFPAMACGRVALVGDSAHSMTSFIGQGACQAIEDAGELANALHAYFGSQSPSPQMLRERLEEYRHRREARARYVFSFSSLFAQLHTGRLWSPMGPLLRWVAFVCAPMWCWHRALTPLYGYQPVVNALVDAPHAN